jgi:hypothetical protein
MHTVIRAVGDHERVRQWISIPEQIVLGFHTERSAAHDVFARLGIDILSSQVASTEVQISEIDTDQR